MHVIELMLMCVHSNDLLHGLSDRDWEMGGAVSGERGLFYTRKYKWVLVLKPTEPP